jgi:hypothetical protein
MYLTWSDVALLFSLVFAVGSRYIDPKAELTMTQTAVILFIVPYLITSLVCRYMSTKQQKR